MQQNKERVVARKRVHATACSEQIQEEGQTG